MDSHLAEGRHAAAAAAAGEALERLPASHRLTARLAVARLHSGDFRGAEEAASRHPLPEVADLEALTQIGQVLAAMDLHAGARAAFARALELRPEDPRLMFNLATSMRNYGAVAEAEALYDACLRLHPDDFEALKNRSDLRRQTPEANHVPELEAALGRAGQDWRGRVMLLYALGKEQEDLQRHAAAFAAYSEGARLRRARLRYDVETDLNRLERLERVFSAAWLSSRERSRAPAAPIFIVGLPRAGSTLLERMLSSHSAIETGGELQNFGVSVARAAGKVSAEGDLISKSAALDPTELAEAYLSSLRPDLSEAACFIDKLPGNSLYAGLIAAALPNALIVHIERDPRDAGFGMFKTLFRQAYPFSYDLTELGRYIRAHERLMRHWSRILPERFLQVTYEGLVDDPEGTLRAILERQGLALEAPCLQPHLNPRASSTASSVQIRQPISKTSVGAWRRHEEGLKPLLNALARETPELPESPLNDQSRPA